MSDWIRCAICEKRTKTYYDKEMAAVEGAGGYVTDCGTGGCPFTTGTTRQETRSKYASQYAKQPAPRIGRGL